MAGTTTRVSTDTNGNQFSGDSTSPAISADGRYVVFNEQNASGPSQVYLADVPAGSSMLVSQVGGTAANVGAQEATISTDGSTVAFGSGASNFGTSNTGNSEQVYVENVATGALTLVSSASLVSAPPNTGGDATSERPSLSANGQIVAFDSLASDIDPADYNYNTYQVYVKDLGTGAITMASAPLNLQLRDNAVSSGAALSADGTVVAFTTAFPQNNGFPTNGQQVSREAYVKNLATNTLTLVSTNTDGSLVSTSATASSISADGNLVAFLAVGGNGAEAYVKNISSGATTLVSADANGIMGNGPSQGATISADGRYVLFESTSTNLGPTTDNQGYHAFVKDLSTGAVTLVHADPTHADASAPTFASGEAFSASDRVVAFATSAALSADDSNGRSDVYVTLPDVPTVTISTLSGVVNNPNQTVSGTVDMADAGTTVGLYDTQTFMELGSGLVNPDGTFNAAVTLQHQGDTEIRAIDTNEGGTGSSAAIGFTLDSIPPTVAITSPGGTTDQTALTLAGTVDVADAGTTVSVFDNGGTTPSGTALVASDGFWSTAIALAQGANALVATDTDSAGNTGTSNTVRYTLTATGASPSGSTTAPGGTASGGTNVPGGSNPAAGATPDTTGPTVTFDPDVGLTSPTNAVLRGTVSDPSEVASLEIYANSATHRSNHNPDVNAPTYDPSKNPIDIGSATVNDNGTWILNDDDGPDTQTNVFAIATDGLGNRTTIGAPFDFQTGIDGQPYTAVVDHYDASDTFTGQRYDNADGSLYQKSTYQALPNGHVTYTYSGGSAFHGVGYSSYTDTYRPDGTVLFETVNNRDGTHQVTALVDGQKLTSIGQDTFAGPGKSENFVLTPGFGVDTITNFVVGGRKADTLSLSRADFGTIAGVAANSAKHGKDLVINDPVSGDKVILSGVSRAEIVANIGQIHLT